MTRQHGGPNDSDRWIWLPSIFPGSDDLQIAHSQAFWSSNRQIEPVADSKDYVGTVRDEFEGHLIRHGRWVLLFARGCGAVDPEAVVQDAFVHLWQRLEAGVRIEDVGAYLAAIVRNACMRAKDRERVIRAGDAAWFEQSDDRTAQGEWTAEEAERLVNSLPDEQREVVVLKVWAEMTFEQIGEALGIPMNTAASRYRYAIISLREREGMRS